MSLYGLCPAQDEFYLVECEHCDKLVKPMALRHHMGKYNNIYIYSPISDVIQ